MYVWIHKLKTFKKVNSSRATNKWLSFDYSDWLKEIYYV
jgi:hypothetical protein